jgi:hypothetical protein
VVCVALVPRCLACSPFLGGPMAPSPHPPHSRPYECDDLLLPPVYIIPQVNYLAVPGDPAVTSTTSPRRRASARATSGKAALTSMIPAIM